MDGEGSRPLPAITDIHHNGFHLKRNIKKLNRRRSHVMDALLWLSAILNLAWCSLQVWQCIPRKEVSWNFLSLLTSMGTLCLEISLVAFLFQENYASGLQALAHTFIISGLIVGANILLKAIFVFGFHVLLFMDDETSHRGKWGLWIVDELLLTCTYAYILFVHYSKWRDKLPQLHYLVVDLLPVAWPLDFGCIALLLSATTHSIFPTFLSDFFQLYNY
ncbi:unnamed protein product [Lactuca virosa]|uniref:Uncharacterized protein n=1 Tax=Lactuca virosa TaxID=75947 RepID=A0AAU9M6S3_9ASTR|nr:unnamed protein product [Lactuca virosa]